MWSLFLNVTLFPFFIVPIKLCCQWCNTQAAQSKKGKAAEKSPAEETAKTITTSVSDADVQLIKEQIESQGQKVRELKAAGATKVIEQKNFCVCFFADNRSI